MRNEPDVREFYDDFSKRVLVRDFSYVNRRHEAVKELCKRFVTPGSMILEIGCGVGIVTKFLAKSAKRVVGIDISPKNIEIARQFAGSAKVHFEVLDAVTESHRLAAHGTFDVVVMADVIEHIPKNHHRKLFAALERILSPAGRVVLTFPSPEIQAYMARERRSDVQVIDEHIELPEILGATSLKPVYFCYRNIFGKNDYVHLVFAADRSFSSDATGSGVFAWMGSRIRKYRWRLANRALLGRLRRGKLAD
jgi:SAM-dependent methyltransferase